MIRIICTQCYYGSSVMLTDVLHQVTSKTNAMSGSQTGVILVNNLQRDVVLIEISQTFEQPRISQELFSRSPVWFLFEKDTDCFHHLPYHFRWGVVHPE